VPIARYELTSGRYRGAVLLDETTLPLLARGCAVLGAGGGGDTYIGLLSALQAIEEHGPVPLVDLDDLPDDDLVMPCGFVGAPTVSIEKLGSTVEGARLREGLEAARGVPVAAIMAGEIGGSNGVQPVSWAARVRLPVVDADGMGRAFPEIPQVTMEIAGIPPHPAVMIDERGNRLVLTTLDGHWMERLERMASIEFGGAAASTEYALTVREARTATVRRSVSFAIRIGRALGTAEDSVASVLEEVSGRRLLEGKVTDVERRTTGGFVRGSAIVEGLGAETGRLLRLEIQNENLVALEDGEVRASVPDIITVLDAQTGEAISTERLRYGQRVTVIAFPCHPIWRDVDGLRLAGPRAFGYDFDYVPVEMLA
jgi:DUF917 family protein